MVSSIESDRAAGAAAVVTPFARPLLQQAQTGDAEALEDLAREAWTPSFVLARAVLAQDAAAEDVAQEAVLAALAGLGNFDLDRPFAPWLHRITLNRCRDQLRRDAARPLPTEIEPAGAERFEPGAGRLPDELVEALLGLSVEQRGAVVLRHLFGLSAAEIAASLETTEVNARTLIHRGLTQLRERLQSTDPAEEASA